jgi:2-polyprenyl-3-methyl-5-hydroxy-6-metoxy-1,4-benzoquinol methylase
MDLDKLNIAAQKPGLYEKGDSVMWTDEYISRRLLEMHLDPEIDSASRMPDGIERTLGYISECCRHSRMRILDLGCGPGIYLEKLAESGHECTGIDFSRTSITYAENQARQKGLDITYICKNYLELDYENSFDLVILIYTDLGVLLPEERDVLLGKIHRALKPGGIFIFDVLNDRNLEEKFQEEQTWSFEFGGFWMADPYLELANRFHYPENRVFLMQHSIIDESDRVRNYRFWTHYFNVQDMLEILTSSGFSQIEHRENILPAKGIWDGENVTFYKAWKSE